LQLRAHLQGDNAARWGEPEWSTAEQAATQGAQQLAQRRFEQATRHYRTALLTLQQLEQQRDQRLATALSTAEAALAENRVAQAIEQYQQVLAIDAAHESARYGLARAQTRTLLLDTLALGTQAEQAGDLLAAQAAFQEAAMLDPDYGPPAMAFARVTAELDAQAFQQAMTAALTALDQGRFRVAARALAQAQALRPDEVAVRDAQQRLVQARQQSQLSGYRRQAAAHVKNENWQAAIALYKRALAIDSAAGFASSGLETATARLKINRQFDHYLLQPERLYAAEPLRNAVALLAAAGSAPAEEPKLANKIDRLQQQVDRAQTPIAITLSSDGETDISIYHVGQLGAFTEYQLELLPGSYTVVGTRYGYRDVHKRLLVSPGSQDAGLSIRCEEPI